MSQRTRARATRPFRFRSHTPETTRSAARRLAGAIGGEGLVLALVGGLGAGKTLFVKGLGEGLGLDPAGITSPTFSIASVHPAAEPGGTGLTHVDLYRLESSAELEAAGYLDWLAPGVVMAVEWADRLREALPPDRLELVIARAKDPRARNLEACALGLQSGTVLARWREELVRGAEVEQLVGADER